MPPRRLQRPSWMLLLAMVLLAASCRTPRPPVQRPPLLPTPATVSEAILANLRPLTMSGLAVFGDWAPDGRSLAFGVLKAPLTLPGQGEPPGAEVWLMHADGSGARRLAEGGDGPFLPFFSPDGETVYFGRRLPHSGMYELWASASRGGKPRRLLEAQGGRAPMQHLPDGRLVLAEWGTYGPLQLLDPASGKVTELTGPFPSNDPQAARLSPDGMRLAYPQGQEVYLANADGSEPRCISEGGGFDAHVWWSPDGRYLVYTTGAHPTDRLLLADGDGRTLATLFPRLEESGCVSTVAWAPDSRRFLVTADAYSEQLPQPTQLYLFDVEGRRQLLAEMYLAGVAWSPNGRTVALDRWDGPQGELASHSIWLAELADRAAVAQLPPPSPFPTLTPTPPLPHPAANLRPEDVARRFWQAIDRHDYRTAYGALATLARERQVLSRFAAEWQCARHATVVSVRPVEGDEQRQTLEVVVKVDQSPDCSMWRPPHAETYLVREAPGGPWLIEGWKPVQWCCGG